MAKLWGSQLGEAGLVALMLNLGGSPSLEPCMLQPWHAPLCRPGCQGCVNTQSTQAAPTPRELALTLMGPLVHQGYLVNVSVVLGEAPPLSYHGM